MKKKWILGIGIFLLLTACTLSATQEQAFSNQMGIFIKSVNDGSTLKVVSMTHPAFVRYVKKQGPEFFKSTFAPGKQEHEVQGSTIRQTVKKNKRIHILFEVEYINYSNGAKTREKYVGISENDGVDWFFMPYEAYKNKSISKELKRMKDI